MDPGDIRNLFRGFFGFPNHRHPNENYNRSDRFGVPPNGHFYHDDDDGDGDGDWLDAEEHNRGVFDGNPRGFSVYTDPLEIHRFFDQQMDEMLKIFGHSFGLGGFSGGSRDGFGVFGNMNPSEDRMLPFNGPREEGETLSPHARDFMLKEDDGRPKVDTEVEWEKLDMNEIDKLMGRKDEEKPPRGENIMKHKSFLSEMFPELHQDTRPRRSTEPGFSFQSFGSSMSEKTVRNPNGGLETTRTVRKSDGSETVSVTKQLGDQSYNLVTTRDKTGATSSEENLTNISEADIESFKRSFDMRSAHQPWAGPQQNPRQDMIQTQPPLNDSTYFKLWDKFFGK